MELNYTQQKSQRIKENPNLSARKHCTNRNGSRSQASGISELPAGTVPRGFQTRPFRESTLSIDRPVFPDGRSAFDRLIKLRHVIDRPCYGPIGHCFQSAIGRERKSVCGPRGLGRIDPAVEVASLETATGVRASDSTERASAKAVSKKVLSSSTSLSVFPANFPTAPEYTNREIRGSREFSLMRSPRVYGACVTRVLRIFRCDCCAVG